MTVGLTTAFIGPVSQAQVTLTASTVADESEQKITITDNFGMGVIAVTATELGALTEGGTNLISFIAGFGEEATYTVTNNNPADVQFVVAFSSTVSSLVDDVTSGHPLFGQVSQELSFYPRVDDNIAQGTKEYSVVIAWRPASSTSTVTGNTASVTLTGIIRDDDGGFTLDPDPFLGNTLDDIEEGAETTFTVVLDAQPASDVVLTLTSSTQVSLGTDTLTFTSGNWSTAQTVTVTGNDNDLIGGDEDYTVMVSVVDGSSDDAYDDLVDDQILSGTVTDNDLASVLVDATNLPSSEADGYFVVKLPKGPLTNVVLDVTSSGEGLATTAPFSATKLTFTGGSSGNWNTLQTIMVTAGVDNNINADETYTITVSVDDDNSDDAFDSVPNNVFFETIIDDDVGEFTLSPTTLGTIAEGGASTSFTVVLDAQPRSNVELTLTQRGKPVSLSAATLTFTSGNWNGEQTIMVSGEDNTMMDGDLPFTITVDVDTAASDDDFNLAPIQEVSGIVSDDEVPGFKLLPFGGASTLVAIDENSGETTFTVVLNINPTGGDVVIDVTSSDTAIATVDSAELTFTNGPTGNWDTEQTVTVTAVDDSIVSDRDYYIITVAVDGAESTSTDYGSVANQELTGTVTDDDAASAGFTLSPTSNSTLRDISEVGRTTFTAVLNAQPSSDVVLTLTSSDTDVATVTANLTFTPSDWNTPQTANVAAVNNDIIDGDQDYTITVAVDSGPGSYGDGTVTNQELSGTVTEDDAAFIVSIRSLSTSIAEGESTTFTVVLNAQPASDVVLTLTSSDTDVATVTSELTFTPRDWNVTQTVDVAGVDNDILGDQNYVITVDIDDDASDDNFDDVFNQRISGLTVTDDDTAGFTLSPTPTLTSIAEGVSTTFTAVLDAQPTSDVVLTLTSSDTDIATVTSMLTFTPDNWSTSQTVNVAGVNNNLIDGPRDYTITVAIDDDASDDDFDGVVNQELSGTVTDNDFVTPSGSGIPALGATTIHPVAEDATPATTGGRDRNVALNFISGTSVTVTNQNPEVVNMVHELTGRTIHTTYEPVYRGFFGGGGQFQFSPINNDVVDGDREYKILVESRDSTVSTSNTNTITLTGTVTDDDVAAFTLDTTNLPNSESSGYFEVSLAKGPLTNVVVDVTSSGEGLNPITPLSATKLTFTGGSTGNWNTAQTIMVTPEFDFNINAEETYTITVSVDDDNSDNAFDSLTNEFTGTIFDDDVGEFTLSKTDLGTIAEGGSTSFNVVLDAEPRSNVVLTLTMSGKPVSLSASTLTFTSGNWNNGQTIMVEGVDNSDMDGDLPFTITVDVDTAASDDDFNLAPILEVSGIVSDDEVPGFKLVPLGGASTLVAIDESSGQTTTTFTVVLNTNPASGDVVIDVTSSDTAIATVDSAELTFTNGPTGNWDTEQTVTVTAVDDDTLTDKNYIITVAVDDANSDDDYDTITQELSGIVTNDDTAGFTLSGTALGTISENGGSTSFTVVLDAEPSSNVELALTTSGKAVSLSATTLTFTSGNWNNEQTVMVTGENNDVSDGNLAFTVTAAIVDASSDDNFDGLNEELSGIVSDDDIPGFQLNPSVNLANISEDGDQTTFTVVLNTQPTSGDVVIDLTSLDPAIATVVPAKLTFTTADWNTEKTGTVTSLDDNTIIDKNYTIRVAVDDANSSDEYDGLSSTLSGTVINNDMAGFTLVPPVGSTLGTISENGGSTSFTVVLDAGPSNNVVLTLTKTGKVSLSNATLTFTSGNWNNEQTVMVTGENNDASDGDLAFTVTVAIVDDDSDAAYRSVSEQERSGIVSDDDVAGFQLNPSVNLADISEGSGQTTFTVVLNTQPTSGNVVIDLTASDPVAIATVVPAKLTFDSDTWDMAQTATVTAVDDDTIGATIGAVVESYTIAVAVDDANSSAEYASASVSDLELSGVVTEDDSAGLTFDPSTLADITEGGDPITFTVRLSAQPTSDVTLSVTSSNPDNATVSCTPPVSCDMLIFTGGDRGNYGDEQAITVTPRDDNEESQSDVVYTITFTATTATSSDPFNFTRELQGTVRDDDGLSEEQTEVAIASADTFGTAQVATDLISGHLLAPPAVQPQAQLAGIALGSTTNLPVHSDLEQDPWGNDEDNAWQHDIADLIPGTEFTLPLSDTDSRGGHYEIWGAAGYSDLSGDPTSKGEKTEYDGHATGVHIGIGRRYVNGTSFGVSIGSTKVKLDIDTGSGDPVKVERDLISIHPYIGWTLQDGLAAWLIAGYGDGDYEQDKEQTDASLLMLGGGVQRSWSVNGNDVAVRLEGVTTESKLDTKGNLKGESSAWQGRVEFEIARSFAAAGGGHVQPYGTFGYRYDGGDLGGSGAGEIGLGLRSQLAASWTIDVKSRFQVTDSDHERRSIQGHVKYDRDTDRRGWLFTLSNSFEYEVEDADTAAEYTRVLAGSVGYGWSRTLLSQRGTLDLHLKASRGDEQEEPVIGFGFTSPLLRLGLDGSEEEVELYFNYINTSF